MFFFFTEQNYYFQKPIKMYQLNPYNNVVHLEHNYIYNLFIRHSTVTSKLKSLN